MALSVAPPGPHLVPPVARAVLHPAGPGHRRGARWVERLGNCHLASQESYFNSGGELVWLLNHLNPNLFGYG